MHHHPPEKIFSGGKGGRGPQFLTTLFQKGGERFATPPIWSREETYRRFSDHFAPSCAVLRRLAPSCAVLRRLAPSCAVLRRLIAKSEGCDTTVSKSIYFQHPEWEISHSSSYCSSFRRRDIGPAGEGGERDDRRGDDDMQRRASSSDSLVRSGSMPLVVEVVGIEEDGRGEDATDAIARRRPRPRQLWGRPRRRPRQ